MIHICEKIHSWYYALPDFHRLGLAGKVIDKLMAKVLKRLLDRFLPQYYIRTSNYFRLRAGREDAQAPRIICSLTSFPARIDQVWIAIETLLHQTIQPDKIILWLSEEQFPARKLPASLVRLQERGLEVVFCKDDLKAHKKYVYALTQFPEDYVITFDDDLYYDRRSIENLLLLKRQHPGAIVTNRAHRMVFSGDKRSVQPYRKWQHNTTFPHPSKSIVATGGCGTLYERNLLHHDVCDAAKIRSLSFYADDIWLKAMTHKQGTLVVTNNHYGKDPIIIGKTQREKLVTTNVLSGGNDQQLADLMEHYTIAANSFAD